MSINYLKLVLDDEVLSVHICEEYGLFYLIRKFNETYGVVFFMYSDKDLYFVGGWDYKHLSSAKRKCKEFYNTYEKINKENLKKVLTSKNIML